jgi:hypothetical protein
MNNPDFDQWSIGSPSVYVCPAAIYRQLIRLLDDKNVEKRQKAGSVLASWSKLTSTAGVSIFEGIGIASSTWLISAPEEARGNQLLFELYRKDVGSEDAAILQLAKEIEAADVGVPVLVLTDDKGLADIARSLDLDVLCPASPLREPSVADRVARIVFVRKQTVASTAIELPPSETVPVELRLLRKELRDDSYVARGEGVVRLHTREGLDFEWVLYYWPYVGDPKAPPDAPGMADMPVENLKEAIAATLQKCASPFAGTSGLSQLKSLQDFPNVVESFMVLLAPASYRFIREDAWDLAKLDEELLKIPQEEWGSELDSKERSEIMKGRTRFGHFLLDRALDVWDVGETIKTQVVYRPYDLCEES